MEKVSFFSLGGIDENGKNSYVLEIGSDIFLIDAGVRKPIISRLGIDTLIPMFTYLKENASRFKNVFISHIHDENFAALPWLIKEVPNLNIYASDFSLEIIKDRLLKYNINAKSYKLHLMPPTLKIGNRVIHSISLAHSIPGNLGFIFETKQGPVIYTSDYVIDHPFKGFGTTDLNRLQKLVPNRSLLWIVDASKGHMSGFAREKAEISKIIYPFMTSAPEKSRIIVGAFDEEMTAIHEILLIARKLGRPVAFYGREYSQLIHLFCKLNPNFILPKVIPYQRVNKQDNVVIIVTGKGERLYERFFRILDRADVYLKIAPSDYVLTVMPPINGHEKKSTKVLDDVMKITRHVMEVSSSQFNKFQPRFGDIKTIFKIIKPSFVVPIRGLFRYLNTTVRKLSDENLIQYGNCFVLKNGRRVTFENKKCINHGAKVQNVGEVVIDGFGVGDVSTAVIREREQLSANGVVIISLLVEEKTHKLVAKPIIDTRGVLTIANDSEMHEKFEEIINDVFESEFAKSSKKLSRKDLMNLNRNIQYRINRVINKIFMKKYGKNPVIIPIINEL